MRIVALTRYSRLGASSRVRFYQYLPYFKANGIDVEVLPLTDDAYLRNAYSASPVGGGYLASRYVRRIRNVLDSGTCDLLWIEKELLPWAPAWMEHLLIGRTPYALDFDDAIFHKYDDHPRGLVRRLFGRKIDGIMRGASLVVAGNRYLAERAREAGARDIAIVPSVIDLDRYQYEERTHGDAFTIGWIGSPTTTRHVLAIRAALREVCAGGRARVVLVGAEAGVSAADIPAEIRPWSEETEVAEIHGFDVGIMPLPDDRWERGKCGYKLIQYMGCSRPVVGSPVGVNTEIIANGVNGFLASDHSGWVRALRAMSEDRASRDRMGQNGRKLVAECFSLEKAAPRLRMLLERAGGRS